jgi:hypothetical protein
MTPFDLFLPASGGDVVDVAGHARRRWQQRRSEQPSDIGLDSAAIWPANTCPARKAR